MVWKQPEERAVATGEARQQRYGLLEEGCERGGAGTDSMVIPEGAEPAGEPVPPPGAVEATVPACAAPCEVSVGVPSRPCAAETSGCLCNPPIILLRRPGETV